LALQDCEALALADMVCTYVEM